MKIGNREFKLGNHTYVWGILNITPDSFSDGGRYNEDTALFHVEKMIKEGADVIDVGGQSTRPGHEEVSENEEIGRIAPVIRKIKKNFDIPVSVDTYRYMPAKAAMEEGADIINDIWGFKRDVRLAALAKEKGVPVCLMHNREGDVYNDFYEDIKKDLMESILIARAAGIKKEDIILDPGIGFSKNYSQNLLVLNRLGFLKEMGYPLLLGASRKSFIGKALKLGNGQELSVNNREEGTMVTSVLAVQAQYDFIRVHDVEKNVRAVRMMEEIRNAAKSCRNSNEFLKEVY